eukprot:168339_1
MQGVEGGDRKTAQRKKRTTNGRRIKSAQDETQYIETRKNGRGKIINTEIGDKNVGLQQKASTATKKANISGSTSKDKSNAAMAKKKKLPLSQAASARDKRRQLNTRMLETRRRKEKLEKERVERLKRNRLMREKRLKKKSTEKKMTLATVNSWIIFLHLGSRLQLAVETVMKFRAYQQRLHLENSSAKLITRQMRIYAFRCYRKRIMSAMIVIARAFIVKLRLWRLSRRRVARERIQIFLEALEKESFKSGGCLALIVKGKKWRAYRMKMILLQRLWRQRLNATKAQVLLVDLQWQREQSRRTDGVVECLYKEEERKVAIENERIDNVNRTRKLIKLRAIAKVETPSREKIRKRLEAGIDLLSVGHITPTEIRYQVIQDFLRHLRRIHRYRMRQCNKEVEHYESHLDEENLHRNEVIRFSGSTHRSMMPTIERGHGPRLISANLKVILKREVLEKIISIGDTYVEQVRKAWLPNEMATKSIELRDIEEAAILQLQHIQES